MARNEQAVKNDLFGFGDKNVAYAKYFIGTSYLNGLVPGGGQASPTPEAR